MTCPFPNAARKADAVCPPGAIVRLRGQWAQAGNHRAAKGSAPGALARRETDNNDPRGVSSRPRHDWGQVRAPGHSGKAGAIERTETGSIGILVGDHSRAVAT